MNFERHKYINQQINAQPWVRAPRKMMNTTHWGKTKSHALLIGLDWSTVNSKNSCTLNDFWAACHYNWQRCDIEFSNVSSALLWSGHDERRKHWKTQENNYIRRQDTIQIFIKMRCELKKMLSKQIDRCMEKRQPHSQWHLPCHSRIFPLRSSSKTIYIVVIRSPFDQLCFCLAMASTARAANSSIILLDKLLCQCRVPRSVTQTNLLAKGFFRLLCHMLLAVMRSVLLLENMC